MTNKNETPVQEIKPSTPLVLFRGFSLIIIIGCFCLNPIGSLAVLGGMWFIRQITK